MSSSFLKPSVTPSTALATRLRARPWNLPSCGSAVAVLATSNPPSTAKSMPAGCSCFNLPFGPCTSTAPSWTLTVTPLGIVMGFLPILDMSQSRKVLPHVTKNLAADAGLDGGSPGHHAARSRQDAGAESAKHFRHVFLAKIDAAAGAADPLDASNQAFAVRPVFQKQAQGARARGRDVFEQFEPLDVAF